MSHNSKQNVNNDEPEKEYALIGDQMDSSTNSCIKRINERDKCRSIEHKRMKKEKKYWTKEDNLLLTHIPYNGESTNSPHILINKWFH